MAYNHYRYAPGWGTQQFQLGAPPHPSYQPQPTWTGQDFYSAHVMGGDPRYYQNTISRLSNGLGGVGKHEAKMWHRRAYAGWGEVTRMQPQEIGAAAAYEAYRQIKYGQNTYDFLYTDFERQREALHAMAIAEAVRLWQDTGRAVDQYGLQAACDAAAGAASNISMERRHEDPYGMGYGNDDFRSRRNSFGAFPGYAGSGGFGAGSVYGGDSPLLGGRSIPGSPIGPSPIPIAGSYSGMGMGGGVPYAGSLSPMGGMPMSYGGYGGSYGSPGNDYLGVQGGGYPGGYASMPGTPGMMLIQPADDHHHRRHRSRSRSHHHHRRHRSHDRY